jgi:hypothetical protein
MSQDEGLGPIVRDARVTSAYMRLLDKGVLKESSSLNVREMVRVRFSYDRMFEYLLTRKIVSGVLDLERTTQLVAESRRFPSLWGAVRSLLIDQLEQRPSEMALLTELCIIPNNIDLTNLAIDALSVYAAQSQLARREVEQYVTTTLLPKKLAAAGIVSAQVGYRLMSADILEQCLLSPIEETNRSAMLSTFYLWSHPPKEDDGRQIVAEVYARVFGQVKRT